ncbi:MAG: hypothetical protein ABUS49_05380 [Acidobacteriota bacterium]
MRWLILLVSLASLRAGVVIDRVAVVVGKHVIKASDIDRDLRVTGFLNAEPLAMTAQAKRKAADRLVDQAVIRDEIITGQYRRASDSDARAMFKQLVQDRFGGSEARLRQALTHYGLTGEELTAQLLWQLTVLRFIDQRFQAGVNVTDEEIDAYYKQHSGELRRRWPAASSPEALQPKIRELLAGQQVNEQFEAWLDAARTSSHVEFREGAFQ